MSAICAVVYIMWTDAEGIHHPRVLTGRCRVAPLLGTTIPRGELQALVVLHRLVTVVVDALPYRLQSISVYTDSFCSIGALRKSTSVLRPFFANRVMEIGRLREQLTGFTDDLPPVSHIPGEQNPADLGTRGLVSVGDLGPGSTWQVGPAFLAQGYEVLAPANGRRDTIGCDTPRRMSSFPVPSGEGTRRGDKPGR